jgi:hypothetical protein
MDDETRREDDQANDRTAERGDVAEPDAPTGAEENEGMSTILSVEPMSGVQEDDEE